ncbi:MAG: hypothetical protein IJS58_00850 [Bacilli bacterium]|nr:hypothetical protein [Bacilli bacterium]
MNRRLFKSIFIVFVMIVSLFAITACEFKFGGTTLTESDEESVAKVLSSFAIEYDEDDSIEGITKDLTFFRTDLEGVSVTIESNNQDVISNDGHVTRPKEDTEVTITIKAIKGDVSLTRSIKVTVLAQEGNPDDPITGDVVITTIEGILALTVAEGETTATSYKVTGTIKSVENTTYGNVYITDGNNDLLVYGLLDADGKKYGEFEYKPIAGDEITITGPIKNYNGTLEFYNATINEVKKGEHVELEVETIEEVLAKEAGESAKISGTVIGTHARGFLVQDSTGTILVYMNKTAFTYTTGDIVTVEGALATYHNRIQFGESATIEKTGQRQYVYEEAELIDASNIVNFVGNPEMGKYVLIKGNLVIDGTYYNIGFTGATNVVSITYPTDAATQTLNKVVGSEVTINALVLDLSSDGTRLNVLFVGFEGEIEYNTTTLPQTYDFTVQAKDSTVLPEGWTWIKVGKAYATLWQSFRNNGEGIQSPMFDAVSGVKVSFRYYLNNSTTGTTKIKVTAYDVNGTAVASSESDNIGQGDIGINNAKTLEFTLKGNNICYVTIEMVKSGGGNIGFNQVILEAAN